mmetsp:Transcript_121110/g.338018  ORF Transcript_121110/g.338018 Transcript_121110/m.338018 type:complete len:320 (-) Transcript_121110:12-971(-)
MDMMAQARRALEETLVSAPGQQAMGQGTTYWSGDTSDPFKVLSQVEGVSIKEMVKALEVLVGFEMGNKYQVQDLRSGALLFSAKERFDGIIGVIGRNAVSGNQRPFNVDLAMMRGEGVPPEPFLHLERPFKCTCCCWGRPVTIIRNLRTQEKIGGVIEPFACCQYNLKLFDGTAQEFGEVRVCCTAMCCFGCPCGCQEVSFPVQDPQGKVVAVIKKQFTAMNAVGMATGLAVDTDHFTVHFTQGLTPEQKAHAIATAIVMDFAYFTKGGSEQREGSAINKIVNFDGEHGQEAALLEGVAGLAAGLWQASQQQQQQQQPR